MDLGYQIENTFENTWLEYFQDAIHQNRKIFDHYLKKLNTLTK